MIGRLAAVAALAALATLSSALASWTPGAVTGAIVVTASTLGLLALAARGPAELPLALAATSAPPRPPAPTEAGSAIEAVALLLASLAEGVLLLDAQGDVVLANPAAARILDRPPAEFEGSSLIRATREAVLVEAARTAGARPALVEITGGRRLWVSAADIAVGTARRALVIEDRSALARAERARVDLIANVSHELRTPLTAARALAETLRDGVEDEARRERFLDQLLEGIDRLTSMVERLLQLSRLESGAVSFVQEPLAPADLFAEATSAFAPLLERREVRVETRIEDPAPVLVDRARVLEVLSNLLDNALRYSPPRGTIRLRAFALPAEPAHVCIEVADEGPGLLPSERERAFERFFTGDPARAPDPSTSGSGLGLSIARHTVEQLGGRIWFEPAERGAVARFTLPRAGGTEG
ncbi:MAG: ATP-binding protein [Dehalococcoidia bacterium]